jgi:hypothetical protein
LFAAPPQVRLAARPFLALNGSHRKGNAMHKSAPFAAELATQVALAAAIGLAVSLALAAFVLLLAA